MTETVTATATATTGPSVTVTVVHDGKSAAVVTNGATVAAVLQQLGLKVGSLDKVSPGTGASVGAGATIKLVRVTQTIEKQNIDVPFRKVRKNSDKVELGMTKVTQQGANGLSQEIVKKTFQDGNLVSTVAAGTQVVRAPRDDITSVGTHQPAFVPHGGSQSGTASWYGSSGLSSASPSLPFGTVVRVTNVVTGHSVNVVIRDRGPSAGGGRVVDLSATAFAQIAPLGSGLVQVKLAW